MPFTLCGRGMVFMGILGFRHRFAVALVGAGLLGVGLVTVAPGTPAAATTVGLTVSGHQLDRDGVAYTPRGFNLVGLLTPAWCANTTGAAAAANFGPGEM